jgi:hypothetical protein
MGLDWIKWGSGTMIGFENKEIILRLALVRSEHGDLDAAIAALIEQGVPDQLQLARLKKRKLRLKDEITILEGQLVPNIIA